MIDLSTLAQFLVTYPGGAERVGIHEANGHASESSGKIRLGDGCAAIANPSGNGHLLFSAAEMLESFVKEDPWFAGYSTVMVNLSDIAAMGGRPAAITDIHWSPSEEISALIWQGMQAAARAHAVPIVGGHTTRTRFGNANLGAAALGHASDRLITSFDAKPGDHLVIAIDMHGGYRGDHPFWDSSAATSHERLQLDLEMLPSLAEKGLCRAGKVIGSGGIIGTLAKLCQGSGVGAIFDLENLPCPMNVEIERWLVSTPSFGYLLAINPEDLESTLSHFTATRITCRDIGRFTDDPAIIIAADGEFAAVDFGVVPALVGAL